MDYLKDYIEVKDRIQTFYEMYPNGAIHFDFKGELTLNNETYIWGRAFAYPERDKLAYSNGTAWERVPAKGFARGSELMVLETSAVGRALAMLGIKVSRSIASREEMLRMDHKNDPWQSPDSPTSQNKGKISQEQASEVPVQGQGLEMSHFGNYRIATEKQINYLHSLCKGIYTDWDKDKLLAYLQYLAKGANQEFAKLEFAPYTIVKNQLDNKDYLADNLSAWLNASKLPSSHEQAEDEAADWKSSTF